MLELVVAGAFLVAASAIAALDTAPARAVSYSLARRRRRRRRQPEHDVRRRTGDRQRGGKARAGRTESPAAPMRGGPCREGPRFYSFSWSQPRAFRSLWRPSSFAERFKS